MASNVLNSVIYVIPIETRIFFNSFASTLQIHQLNVYGTINSSIKLHTHTHTILIFILSHFDYKSNRKRIYLSFDHDDDDDYYYGEIQFTQKAFGDEAKIVFSLSF